MEVCDFDGTVDISEEPALIHRLHSVRRGRYGAFILSHNLHPYLFLHFNGDVAYVHYFPSDGHPGYQPGDMTPDGCTQDVHFLQVNGTEADSFDMPPSTLVAIDVALTAACEFLGSPTLPSSISWFEL